jgi:hypothetical protein
LIAGTYTATAKGDVSGLFFGGESTDDSSSYFTGSMSLYMDWARVLTDVEAICLSANPWQLFTTRRKLLPAGAAITSPTLTAAQAFNITSSSAQARVTFTRP